MEAALVTGKNKLELIEMPTPEPKPGAAVVDIAYCGICGTDLHAYQSGEPYNPAICGHEWCGTVSAVLSEDKDYKEGDRVAIGVGGACGQCATCLRGDGAHCEKAFLQSIGMSPGAGPHGGFAPSICVEVDRLYAVQKDIDDVKASMLEPATVAVHAVRRTEMRLGDTAVVLGAGPIGLLALQAAKAAGAGTVILVEPQQGRRELGRGVGADILIDPTKEDVLEIVNGHVGAEGADVVFECAGIPQTIDQSVGLVRRGGVVSLVGFTDKKAQIDPAQWLIKEVRLVSSLAYVREEFDIAQGLIADGRIKLESLHTSTVSLAKIEDAFKALATAPEEIKILVDPRLA